MKNKERTKSKRFSPFLILLVLDYFYIKVICSLPTPTVNAIVVLVTCPLMGSSL